MAHLGVRIHGTMWEKKEGTKFFFLIAPIYLFIIFCSMGSLHEGVSLVAVHRFLVAVASLVAEHRL